MHATLTLGIFATVFTLIYQDKFNRLHIMVAGSACILLVGLITGGYTPLMALKSIYFDTLALIFGMSMISAVLAKSGLFAYIAERAISYSRGSGWVVVILLILLTYLFSLMANNLAAMVVMLPLSLTLCSRMGINPIPLLISEIIASNLGGASTMIGDFPNMIISGAASLGFLDFIGGMMVPTLILLAALLLLMQHRKSEFTSPHRSLATTDNSAPTIINAYLFKLGISTLVIVLILFIVSGYIGLAPAYISLVAGIILIELGTLQRKELLIASGARDILFFSCLFIMVGGLNAAGILEMITSFISSVGGGNKLLSILLLMWISAILTLFLNAGPTTALFIPVAMSLSASFNDITVWWALSLGVLAGSSGSLTGATAGSLVSSHLKNFNSLNLPSGQTLNHHNGLSFKEYLHWGLPVMGIFLGISTLYLILTLY